MPLNGGIYSLTKLALNKFRSGAIASLFWFATACGPSDNHTQEHPQVNVPQCDSSLAADALFRRDLMLSNTGSRLSVEDGWQVVRLGGAYAGWTVQHLETWVALYADQDAGASCVARKIEFQSPAGRVVATADPIRGIRIK